MNKHFSHTKKAVQTNRKSIDYDEDACDWDETGGGSEEEEYVPEEDAEYFEEEEYAPEEDAEYFEEEEYALEEDAEYLEEEEYALEEDAEYLEEEEYSLEEDAEYLEEEEYALEEDAEYFEEEEYAPEEDAEYFEVKEYDAEEDAEYFEEEEYAPEEDAEYLEEEEYVPEEEDAEYFEEEEYVPEEDAEYFEEEEYAPGRAGEYDGIEEENWAPGKYAVSDSDRRKRKPSDNGGNINCRKDDFWSRIKGIFGGMETMDKMMFAAGVGAVVLAFVIAGHFFKTHAIQKQVSEFVSVGTQLEGITVIGEEGLAAVANAEAAKLAASEVQPSPEPSGEPPKEYDEKDYDRQVSVEPDFTSIQKDMKIKFINSTTNKLVANVPFSVTIVDPDGSTFIWSDDDMDGIIMKKDLKPGKYKVTMEALTDSKYAGYMLSTLTRTVEVKKEIVYSKVDVANEVKTEAEVNASQEDTRKNETVVESVLKDTVAWVESKVFDVAYNEVPKSTIPDPLTYAAGRRNVQSGLVMLEEEVSESVPQQSAEPADESEATESSGSSAAEPDITAEPSMTPGSAEESSAESDPAAEPSKEPVPTPEATPTPGPVRGTVTVDSSALSGTVGSVLQAKAEASGFSASGTVGFTVESSAPEVATATVDAAGNVSITGVGPGTAVITVTANYEGGTSETAASFSINAVIGGKISLTLDKSSLTVFLNNPDVIRAEITNAAVANPVVQAESSDTGVAGVSVENNAVTVSGIAEGSAVITVKYTEGGEEVQAECTVTVKKHPSENKDAPLKNADGEQLYVMENNEYRAAVVADYYTAEKFFVQAPARYTGWQTIGGKLYYYTAEGNAVTGEQVIQGAKYNFASDGSLVVGNGAMGIDVSKWNGNIDWNAVKNSGVSYVIIRCGYRGSSQGQMIEDPAFTANIKGASAAGLKIGIYFFSQAIDEVEAVEEASMVLGQIKNYTISYPVFIDVEASGGRADAIDKDTRTAVCRAFCQTIQNAGYTAGIYANKTWLENKIDTGSLGAYKIWLAQYVSEPTYAGRYDLWQYRPTGSVSGISGDVDMNISYLGY